MGYTGAAGMAGAVGEGHANLRQALSWHLGSNHFPPVPQTMIEPCIEAVRAAVDDEWVRDITLPDGVTYRDGETAPAWAIIEGHHLEPFVDMMFETVEDGDEVTDD